MIKKLSERQNIIIGSILLIIITFAICYLIVICNPVEKPLHPLEIAETNTVEFINEEGEDFSVTINPIDCTMEVDQYIDYEKLENFDYYETDELITIDFSKLDYNFIKNIEDIPTSDDITKEAEEILSKYAKNGKYDEIPEDVYKKISNDVAFDYDSYLGYYYNMIKGAPYTKENLMFSIVLQALAKHTTIKGSPEGYIETIYNGFNSAIGLQAKKQYANNLYIDVPEDVTEEELNYLLFEFADNDYKRLEILLHMVDKYELWPTDEEINDLLQKESKRLGITEEEYLETVKSKEYLKNHIANQNAIKFVYEKVMENK